MKQSFLILHLSIFIAGFTGIFGRLITLDTPVLVWWRSFFAALFFYIILKAVGRLKVFPVSDIIKIASVGAVFSIHWLFFYGSIKASNVSVGVVCFSLTGFFTAFVEPVMLKTPFRWRDMCVGLLAVLGIFLIFHFDSRYRLGIGLGILSSLAAAIVTTLNKKILPSYPDTPSLMFYEIIGGLFFLTALSPLYTSFFPVHSLIPDGRNLMYLVIFALFCTIGLQFLQLYALKKISAFTVNLSFNLEPVYTIILAALIFNEMNELNYSFFIGVSLIMLSVILQMWSVLRRGA